MADYYTPTVVQQTIPPAAMTPIETLILRRIFDSETIDGNLYFFSECGPDDAPRFDPAELRQALEQSKEIPSSIYGAIKDKLASADPSAGEIELDLSIASWECIFQDIVKRSPALSYISVVASFICMKMRPDGFGGMVTLITAQTILVASTGAILEKWLAEQPP